MTTTSEMQQLRRVRLFVRGCFWTGVLVSLIANVLHADPNPISQAIAAWAPLALLLAVELLSRVPITTRSARSWLRMIATGIVAAIAAWVSYWHMVGVATEYGETGLIPYLLPISVDGLVVIASISLVEVNQRIHQQPHTTDQKGAPPQPAATQPASGTTRPTTPARAETTGDSTALHAQARLIANAHHRAAGTPITAADLASRMNISETEATTLLATITPTTTPGNRTGAANSPAPAINGTPVAVATAVQEPLL